MLKTFGSRIVEDGTSVEFVSCMGKIWEIKFVTYRLGERANVIERCGFTTFMLVHIKVSLFMVIVEANGVLLETLIHAFKDCPTYRAILSICGQDNSTISKEYECYIDWLEDMMRVLDKKAMPDVMTTLWNSWNNRNNFTFRGKEDEAQVIWDKARTLSQEFRICNLINDPLLSTNPTVKRWEKPPKGFVKINFNASVCNNRFGYGVIVRDEDGFVLGYGRGFKKMPLTMEEAECNAFEESIKLVCKLNINSDVIFETDNAYLVNKVKYQCTDITIIGARIKECIKAFVKFKSADLVWTNRSCNLVADLICNKMCTEACTCFFDMDYPLDIHDAVMCDAI
ncbi:hypothetical protein Gogos_021909 [Gossypium gossypioides]|uniref:RNase H type-1 domain-containing protein n=1 Tax=Gossypium gossypioides TaxID=34282 RepID=A0A7J9D4N9_GOSGO|nr:hypothetical protein [Gossypium gossypioides]